MLWGLIAAASAAFALGPSGAAVSPRLAPGPWRQVGAAVTSRPGKALHFYRTPQNPKAVGIVVRSTSSRPIRLFWASYCEFESDDVMTGESQDTATGVHLVVAYPPVLDNATLCYVWVTCESLWPGSGTRRPYSRTRRAWRNGLRVGAAHGKLRDMGVTRDRWAEWLAERRFGGNNDVRRLYTERLARRRDEILDHAGIGAADVVLDVGCGEGLIGFGALERGAKSVVFSDISDDLLAFCRDAAQSLGFEDRCRFVRAFADDLRPVPDASVDVVTTRSVLMYVQDKRAALAEFLRVLRPGGRISLFEPINRFVGESFLGYDLAPLGDIAAKIVAAYGSSASDVADDPMPNFDERDLVRYAEEVGFFPITLRLDVEIRPTDAEPLDTFLNRAPNPLEPPLGEAIDRALTDAERERVVTYLRPLVESGGGVWRMSSAYVSASKPE